MKRKFCLTYGKVFKLPQWHTNHWRGRKPATGPNHISGIPFVLTQRGWPAGEKSCQEDSALPRKGFLNPPRNTELTGLAELLGRDEYLFLCPWVVVLLDG